ncbi:MAG: AMP-binding protein [Myxococcales bacterium]|nr:AMP-binding protein [Myxococcales bacterium]
MSHAAPLVAGLDPRAVDAIARALAARTPLGLVHDRLPADERAALAARLAAATVPADTAAVVFTSGSTGRPKGVVLAHAAAAAAVAASARHLGTRADDRWLLALPPAHVSGLGVILRSVAAGTPPLVAAGGDRASVAAALAGDEVTLASLVPTQLAALLDDPGWRPPPRLRAVLVGGAAAAPALVARARARGVPVLTTYGMSETCGQVATCPPGATPPPGAVGRPLPGVTVVAGTRAAPATIVVRTAAAFTGYLDEPRPDPDAVVTTDLGFVEDGWLFVVGRRDDVIITGGEKVHPAAVEAALLAVPGVAAAGVVAIADPRWGQRVAAAVVPGPGFARVALDAAVAALAPHARPRVIALVDALPRGPTGKLDREAVRALLGPRTATAVSACGE